jgi:hypothetical protein
LTPITAVVLAGAMFLALNPPGDLAREATTQAPRRAATTRSLAAALPQATREPPGPSYVFVLVSQFDHAIIAHRSLVIPQAYIDVRVVTTPEEEAEFTRLLFDMRAQMASLHMPEPLVVDTRGYW